MLRSTTPPVEPGRSDEEAPTATRGAGSESRSGIAVTGAPAEDAVTEGGADIIASRASTSLDNPTSVLTPLGCPDQTPTGVAMALFAAKDTVSPSDEVMDAPPSSSLEIVAFSAGQAAGVTERSPQLGTDISEDACLPL